MFNCNTMNYDVRILSDNWGHFLGGKMDEHAYKFIKSNKQKLTAMENAIIACQFFGMEIKYDTTIRMCSKGKFWSIKVGKAAMIEIYI